MGGKQKGPRKKPAVRRAKPKLGVPIKRKAVTTKAKSGIPALTLKRHYVTVTLIDLRPTEYSLVRAGLRLVDGRAEAEIVPAGGWTLQRLTHHQADGVRKLEDPLLLLIDRLQVNDGYVGEKRRLVLPIDLEAADIQVGTVMVKSGGAKELELIGVLLPSASEIRFPSRQGGAEQPSSVCWISDERGTGGSGPWAIVPPAKPPVPPGAA